MKLRAAIAGYGTQQQVAKAAGIDVSTLSRWINRHSSPRIDELAKVAAVVGKPIAELID